MGQMTKEQPNTMDEPGGPEAPQSVDRMKTDAKNADTGNVRKQKATQGAPTDADFEPPIVPGDTKNSPLR